MRETSNAIATADGSQEPQLCWRRVLTIFIVLCLVLPATAQAQPGSGSASVTDAEVQSPNNTSSAAPNKRQLTVVLYPFLPDFPDFQSRLLAGFASSAGGSDVTVTPVDLSDNYYNPAASDFIGSAKADVYEVDSVFLTDFATGSAGFPKIQPLPAQLIPSPGDVLQSAQTGSQVNNAWYGAPHWVCSNFLFYRAGDSALSAATTTAGLQAIWPTQPTDKANGLLVDLKGKSTLGEFYLMSDVDREADLSTVYAGLGTFNSAIEADVKTLRSFCAIGFCRSQEIHSNDPTYYARQFSRRQGRAYVGYSEGLNGVLTETAQNCKPADACLSDRDVDVNDLPMDTQPTKDMVWVDSFVISASCTAQCLDDAVAFITYATSEQTVLQALLSDSKGVPRYLLPARSALYSNAMLLSKAHLYPKLKAIVQGALAPSYQGLNAALRQDGATLDTDLGP